ncbi:MAG: hypothetical protein AAF570_04385, partial [Bacteroidota bacterium]
MERNDRRVIQVAGSKDEWTGFEDDWPLSKYLRDLPVAFLLSHHFSFPQLARTNSTQKYFVGTHQPPLTLLELSQ